MDFLNNTVLFTLGNANIMLIDIVTSVFGLACVFMAGRNSKYNFWVGYVYTFFLFVMFMGKHLYASLLLQPISLAINVLGHWRWTHPKSNEESSQKAGELKVSSLSWPQRGLCIAAVLVIAALWGWGLSVVGGDPVPYLDSCVTVLILMAQLLSALKKWDCWIAWLLVNVTQMILHISVGNIFMPIVCGLYLVNGIVSLFSWNNLLKKNA
ncbi:MAG: nicotinamide mononucleotide transporter [Bacteroidales bacterium]|nr:nicotinamide mononucleotide transporter [Bacteroidales bacterium]